MTGASLFDIFLDQRAAHGFELDRILIALKLRCLRLLDPFILIDREHSFNGQVLARLRFSVQSSREQRSAWLSPISLMPNPAGNPICIT